MNPPFRGISLRRPSAVTQFSTSVRRLAMAFGSGAPGRGDSNSPVDPERTSSISLWR